MKPITTTALALVMAAAVASPAAAQYGSMGSSTPQQMPRVPDQQPTAQEQKQPSIKPSNKALKALIELQDAVNKNDTANIPAKVAAAQAVAQTKEDRYLIARLQLKAAATVKDNATIAAAIEAIAASNVLNASQLSDLYVGLGGAYYNDKQYPQAAAAYQKALTVNPQNAEAVNMVGEALLNAGQKTEAAAYYQRLIQARASAGQKPEESLYKRVVSIAYEAQSPTAVELARQWVAAYPSQASWNDATAIYRNAHLNDAESTIDVLRLKQALGYITPAEYGLLARTAADQLIFGEAQAALNAGIAAKQINPSSPEFADLVAELKARAKPTTADLAAAMKAAANAKALMRIGDNYAALGDYSHAVQAYRLAMAKPDGDAALANLHTGMALALAGDRAGATAALNAVTGPRTEIAKFWLTYVGQKA
jgi:tetratricopeptide (TPR) repeat protein